MNDRAVDGISIVIPTYNRARLLGPTLEGIKQFRVPEGLPIEVLVIDNNCTDNTARVVEESAQGSHIPILRIRETRQGLCYGRNRGLSEARYGHLAYFDDDIRVCPDWIDGYFQAVVNYAADAVVGPVVPSFDGPCPAFLVGRALEMISSPYSRKGDVITALPRETAHELPGCNFGVRKEVAERLGGFNTALDRAGDRLLAGGDFEFGGRLVAAGFRTVYSPQCAIEHVMIAEKLTKPYLRRRAFDAGVTGRYMRHSPLRTSTRLRGTLGALRIRAKTYVARLAGREAESFDLELRSLEAFGYFWGRYSSLQ